VNAGVSGHTATHRRLPALDGLRGVAILAVLVFHGTLYARELRPTVPTAVHEVDALALLGHNGVTLFFVLSGFLITGILMDASPKPAGEYYGHFYARRARRILPTYAVALALAFVILPLAFPDRPQFAVPPGSGVWAVTFLANFALGRWGWTALPMILGPIWSLAVEEQFYLLWPFLLRRRPAVSVLGLCAGAVIISVATRALCILYAPHAWLWELSTPACIDTLAAGAAVAVIMRDDGMRARLASWAAPVGMLLVVVWLVCPFFERVAGLGVAAAAVRQTALAFAFAAWLARVVTAPAGWSARVLATPPFRFFGKYSYAMYLFNQPVIFVWFTTPVLAALTNRLTGPLGVLACLLLTIALTSAAAVANWYAYERRILTTPFAFSFSESPSR
jgi:peptidoglycan/LPS O-acetylase OafA/YrhL